MRHSLLLVLGLALSPAALSAQATCTPAVAIVGDDLGLTAPTSPDGRYDRLELLVGTRAVGTLPVPDGGTPVNLTSERDALSGARAAEDGATAVWRGPDGVVACQQALTFAQGALGMPPPTPSGTASGTDTVPVRDSVLLYEADECSRAGREWWSDLRRREGRNHTVLVMQAGSGLCWWNRDYGVVGDPIHVGVFTNQSSNWVQGRVSFDPCALEPEAPSVLATGRLADVVRTGGVQSNRIYELKKFAPRRCFNTAVGIVAEGGTLEGAATLRATASLEQHNRHYATVQLGVGLLDNHARSFGLRPDGGESLLFDRGPVDEGPEYLASIVLYGVLHHVADLFGGPAYKGRDILEENSLVDRLGLLVGVGLRNPSDRLAVGASVEVVRGVNAIYGLHFLNAPELAGVEVGDLFEGGEDDIPVQSRWMREWFWGFSLDLRYVLGVLGGTS